MALSDFAVQASRRGFVKKIKRVLLENYISKDYIGSGVKLPSDRTCGMAFCNETDLFVMVSREGFLFSMPAADLPFSVEEALRLGMADHIVSAFAVKPGGCSGRSRAVYSGGDADRQGCKPECELARASRLF